jgi:hypothetical protein
LTEEVVLAATASEVKTGRRVGLGWDMRKVEYSQFGRQKCGHSIIPLEGPGGSGMGACFDDVYNMNPRTYLESYFPSEILASVQIGCPTWRKGVGIIDLCSVMIDALP